MKKLILSLGSNLGDRRKFLNDAMIEIEASIGKIRQVSSLYQTSPWGFDSSELFLNQIILVNTHLSPVEVLEQIKLIEQKAGRIRSSAGFQDRTLDIDIVFYDDLILDSQDLKIPHPNLHQRLFVLMPLHEIAPKWMHPVFQKDITALLQECDDILCHLVKIN